MTVLVELITVSEAVEDPSPAQMGVAEEVRPGLWARHRRAQGDGGAGTRPEPPPTDDAGVTD
jgi:hypothetical protein